MTPSKEDRAFLERLTMDARYHRERRDLYRAKMQGPRVTSVVRLREFEKEYDNAALRLERATLKLAPTTPQRDETS